MFWWWGTPFIAKAPACPGCAWKLHGLRSLSFTVTMAIAVAALWLIWPSIKVSVPRGLQKWAMMAIALVCLIPQFILEALFAKPFEITAYSDSVDYEFTSKEYAVDFAILNTDAEWVKVNGEIINH